MFAATQRARATTGSPWFSFDKADRRVTCFYFYLWDADFGPAFIKICTYFPYPIKVWLNGHEWAKRQAAKAGIGFTELSNGFATCDDPAGLQAICDRLGPGTIEVFFERWMTRLPLPLTAARPRRRLLVGAVDARRSRSPAPWCSTQPRHARAFFEALVADNLDLGRPDTVELIFTDRRHPGGQPASSAAYPRPRSSPAAPRSPSTPSTSTPGSSSTSRTAGRCGSRP